MIPLIIQDNPRLVTAKARIVEGNLRITKAETRIV